MFIGRQTELAKLISLYSSSTMEYGLIYGRRRIGKTQIIKESLKKVKSKKIYYVCKETSERNNVKSLCEQISVALDIPLLAFSTIEETLIYLCKLSTKRTIILILDEYPFLRKNIVGLDSILQSLYENYHETSKLKLILCGSYIDIMKSLLESQNPLYGRMSLILHIKQQDYYESSLYYPSYSLEDKVMLYSVFGGVPFYNSKINTRISALDNILDLIVQENASLETEISVFLKNEISKIDWANQIFESISNGKRKFADILEASHVPSSPTLAETLNRLIGMDILMKEAPINDEKNKKKAKYTILDNLTLFYYTYLFPNLSNRSLLDRKDFYQKIIEEDFRTKFIPRCFESILKQYLIRLNRQGKMNPLFLKIGRYYYDNPVQKKNGEFDVVTYDENGYTFYEAKYRNEAMSQGDIEKEIQQVKETGLNCYRYGFLSKSGFVKTPSDSNLILLTLEDLYRQNL